MGYHALFWYRVAGMVRRTLLLGASDRDEEWLADTPFCCTRSRATPPRQPLVPNAWGRWSIARSRRGSPRALRSRCCTVPRSRTFATLKPASRSQSDQSLIDSSMLLLYRARC